MSPVHRFRFLLLLLTLLLAPIAAPGQEVVLQQDPIAFIGHGTMFDRDGQPIEVTPQFLRAAQAYYIRTLLEQASPETRQAFAEQRRRIEGELEGMDLDDQRHEAGALMVRSGLIDLLLDKADPARDDAISTLRGKNNLIKTYLRTSFLGTRSEPPVGPEIRRLMESLRAPAAPARATFNEGAAYIAECTANGVPIPPDWGSAQWTNTGSLSDAQEFISASSQARVHVWESTSPEGMCIALPRVSGNGSGDIVLLGIICLGKQTSTACFWDNQENDQGFSIGIDEDVPLSDFAGGAELLGGSGGVCTGCHAGENPYVIHPGTPLGEPALSGMPLMGDDWYEPLVHPDWPQNAGPTDILATIPSTGECTSCHVQGVAGRFPQISSTLNGGGAYCGAVLQNAINRTMPPFGTHPNPDFAPHANALLAMCSNAPSPLLRVESEILNYGEVELGFAFSKALVLHNDGDTNLSVSVALTTPAGNPNLAHWNDINELANFNIAPGAPPVVLRQTYAPQALGSHTIAMQVTSNDPSAPTVPVTLTGSGVTPTPIDSVLVLDRSGSMSELAGDQSKIVAMRNAVMLYTDLLRPDIGGTGTGDKLGMIKYNATSQVYFPLTTITNGVKNAIGLGELSNAALGDPGRLQPAGNTGIGGAMLLAVDEIGAPVSGRGQVVVVLTDGKENESPSIADAIADIQTNSPQIQFYSVGLGFAIEPTKLQSITNMGEAGYHQVANTLEDETLFDLETFYFKIFSTATGMDLVTDPTHVVSLTTTDPILVDNATVISSDRSAVFLVLDDPAMRQFYDVEFVTPKGDVIVPGLSVGGIPVQVQSRQTYRIFRIVFPDPAQADEYVGDWVLRIVPNGRWDRAIAKALLRESHIGYSGVINPVGGTVPIGFAGAVASDYRMQASVTAQSFLPGAELRLSAALTDRGWPAADGDVTVTITRPDGVVHVVTLHDDGTHDDGEATDAVWSNGYVQTAAPGVYKLLFRSVGRNERGELAPRLATRYVTLAQPEPPLVDDSGGDGPGQGCPGCEGAVAAYLIGSYDLRDQMRTLLHLMNPSADPLALVVAIFDDDGNPVRCRRDKMSANDLLEIDIARLDPPGPLGVVKVVAFDVRTERPVASIVANQVRQGRGTISETPMHPVPDAILEDDLDRIMSACR